MIARLLRALTLVLLPISLLVAQAGAAQMQEAPGEPLESRIVHSNPEEYRHAESVHDGAGPMLLTGLLGRDDFAANLQFLHRGVILPGGGIGHHFHNASEEMFVILSEGEAEFTINGRTSRIQTPAGVPVTLGNSHAIYNPTEEPLEWMNIAISKEKGSGGAFDLGDPRVGVDLDPIPVFMTMPLDPELLRPEDSLHGGEGTVQYRRALRPEIFQTPWAYVDHLVLPPGTSTGLHLHTGVEEFYYVIGGEGAITVSPDTEAIASGDAIPIYLGEPHSIQNTGSEPLEVMIVGIAMDLEKDLRTIDVPASP